MVLTRLLDKKAIQRLKRFFPLFIILLSSLFARYLFYLSIDEPIQISDSPTYIDGAMSLYYHVGFSEYRPPVYPLILMVLGVTYLWKNLPTSIVILQVILSMICVLYVYKLVEEVFQKKFLSFFTALMVSLSFSIYRWDFMVLTESISILQVTLISYLLVMYFKYRKPAHMRVMLLLLFTSIFTKPFFLLLPVLVITLIGLELVFTKYIYKKPVEIRPIAKTLIRGFCVIYLSVFLYSAINFAENFYFGFSSVGNVNTFGKVLQYNMEDYGMDKELVNDIKTAFKTENQNFIVEGKFLEPWHFIGIYGWNKQHYQAVAKFSKDIIQRHPLEYLCKSLKLTKELFVLKSPFKDYIADGALSKANHPNPIMLLLKSFTQKFEMLYILMIVSLFEMIYLFIFRKKERLQKDGFITFALLSIVLYHYFISAFLSYGDYCRLLAPSYTLIYIILCFYTYRFTVSVLQLGVCSARYFMLTCKRISK